MRIGIFCFYDSEGKVDRYIEYLLLELKKVIDELYVVVNGSVEVEGREIFSKYAKEVYVRENKGFDAGAYKDAMINLIGKNKIQEFDELVFCNDTFFGPFVGFDTIFEEMDRRKADFWGLKYVEDSFFSHLQSYFLVFRKEVLSDELLFEYFQKKISVDTENIADIYATFERGLFYILQKAGYSYASYANSLNCDDYRSGNYSIRCEGLPLLKKKVFDKKYCVNDNVIDAIEAIKECYDIELIKDTVQRKYGRTIPEKKDEINTIFYKIPTMNVTEQEVVDFLQRFGKVYIYGTGVIATCIYYFFYNKIDTFKGFVVSDSVKKEKYFKGQLQVFHMNEIEMRDDIGIIIALNPENSKQIRENVSGIKNILYLWEM